MKATITNQKQKLTIKLVVEGGEGNLWGRVEYDDNLIVEEASTLEELKNKMQILLSDFHQLNPVNYSFEVEYDLTVFFELFDFLKIGKVAEAAGLNSSLVRQYVTGKKNASVTQASKIEKAVKELADKLTQVHIYAPAQDSKF